jgi:hypothetical protein
MPSIAATVAAAILSFCICLKLDLFSIIVQYMQYRMVRRTLEKCAENFRASKESAALGQPVQVEMRPVNAANQVYGNIQTREFPRELRNMYV